MLFIKNCCLQLHHWSNAITISKFCSHNKKSHHCPLIYPEDSLQYLMLNVVQLLRYRTFQDQRKFWKVTMNHILSKIQYKTKTKHEAVKKKRHRKGQFSSYFGNKTLIYTTFNKYLFKAYSENFLLQPFIPSFFYPTLPYMQPFSIFNSIIKEYNLCRMEKIIITSIWFLFYT